MLLYHATFRAHLKSIKEYGLVLPKQGDRLNFEGQEYIRGIYFSTDYDLSGSMLECADNVPDSIYDSGIVILVVNSDYLDKNYFCRDINLIGEDNAKSIVYQKPVPSNLIGIIKDIYGNNKIYRLNEVLRVTKSFLY